MAAATLESLPAEILLQICEYLDRNHIGSVAAFARASKYCYFAVTALLFRTIRLAVSSDILLSKDVQEFYNMLQRSGSFGHVRRLLVEAVPPSADDELDHHNQRHKHQIIPEERGYSDARLGATSQSGGPIALTSGSDLWMYKPVSALRPTSATSSAPIKYVSDGTPSQPWKGFTLGNDKHSSPRGSLQFLKFSSSEGITIQLVKDWRASTDFSVLKTLKLGVQLQRDAAEFLTTNCSFPSLANLSLHLHARHYSNPSDKKGYYDSANRFLCSLPPLYTLHILGFDAPQTTLDTVLGHHGSSLHKLNLSRQRIAADNVLQRFLEDIRDYCPLLEDLYLSIPRSKGDAAEVTLYKTLGSIPQLQRLSLYLEASYISEDCTNDDYLEYEEPIVPVNPTDYYIRRNNHTQDVLINSAVDEPLVRDIFWAIASGKRGDTSALDELTVRTYCECAQRHSQASSLPTVITTLAGGWEVKRNPRDDSPQDLIVEDLRYLEEADDSPLDPFLEPIFRELWPAKHNEGGNWRDDWSSRPLFKPDT
ncbi:hypothetical protein V494_08427 [Pseudogymnoascus sp. VKM F-4513 (FW-928)]|nr:hypothetical protein V494_08427 [Pseudogymnoascus sp. VKM F-4513 (FW-928)]